MLDLKKTPLLLLASLLLMSAEVGAEETGEPTAAPLPDRAARPWSMSYHSHWFLIGGLRAAHRLEDGLTEFSGLFGTAVVTGCAIQAPQCVQAGAVNLGVRRYFSRGRFAAYSGLNIFYLVNGFRYATGPTPMLDLNLGMQWQSRGGFVLGGGYSFLVHPSDSSDRALGLAGWITTEIGYAF
jgi:hypothetical protein